MLRFHALHESHRYTIPQCWAPHTQRHKCTVYGDNDTPACKPHRGGLDPAGAAVRNRWSGLALHLEGSFTALIVFAKVPWLTPRCLLPGCCRRTLCTTHAPWHDTLPPPRPPIHCTRYNAAGACPSVTGLHRASPTSRLRRQLLPCGSFLAERCFRRGRRLPRPSPASGQPRLPQCCTQRTSSIVRGLVARSSHRMAALRALRCASTAGTRRSSTTSCGSPTSPRLHP